MFNRKLIAIAVACLGAQAAMPAAAEDADKCCFRLTPYYWAVGIDGNLKNDKTNQDVDFNQDIGDVTDNLEFNGSLMLEHNLGHWSNFAALDYMKVDNDDVDINQAGVKLEVETDTTLATAATGYRFSPEGESWVDLLVGVRYGKLDVEANLKGGASGDDVNADDDLVDGIVMLRPRIALGKHWAFSPTASVGAGDSDLVWELAPELVYTNDCCNLEFRFGYRTVNYEVEEGDVEADFSFAGPMAGIGFAF
jgi:hypothetical protein